MDVEGDRLDAAQAAPGQLLRNGVQNVSRPRTTTAAPLARSADMERARVAIGSATARMLECCTNTRVRIRATACAPEQSAFTKRDRRRIDVEMDGDPSCSGRSLKCVRIGRRASSSSGA